MLSKQPRNLRVKFKLLSWQTLVLHESWSLSGKSALFSSLSLANTILCSTHTVLSTIPWTRHPPPYLHYPSTYKFLLPEILLPVLLPSQDNRGITPYKTMSLKTLTVPITLLSFITICLYIYIYICISQQTKFLLVCLTLLCISSQV